MKHIVTYIKNHPLLSTVIPLICGFLLNWCFSGIMSSITERVNFSGNVQARYEVTKRAASTMPCGVTALAYQSVVADVLDWNKQIAQRKDFNKRWWTDYTVSDKWDLLAEIKMPCGAQ